MASAQAAGNLSYASVLLGHYGLQILCEGGGQAIVTIIECL